MACGYGFVVLAAQDIGPVGGENETEQGKSLNGCARRHRAEVYRQMIRLRLPRAVEPTVMQAASVPVITSLVISEYIHVRNLSSTGIRHYGY